MTSLKIKEIEGLIEEDVKNRTFSLEAVDAIKSMRDECERQDNIIDNMKDAEKTARKSLKTLEKQYEAQTETVSELNAKIKKFNKREAEQIKIDTDLAVANARATIAVDMAMGLVRNTTYKKTMFGNAPDGAPVKDQYNNLQYGNSSIAEETTVTEE